MLWRAIKHLLRGIKAKSVDVEFFDPVRGVGTKELAHRPRIRAIEIERFTPFILVAVREVIGGELLKEITVRADVVVDHVEDDAQPGSMSPVHEAAEVIRITVEPRGREKIDAIITPAEAARELAHWHHFNHSDTKCR